MEVRLKRVYDPESPGDGFRVLVDKLWPRGIRKEAFHYDLWAKRIAPSTSLRVWYHGPRGIEPRSGDRTLVLLHA